MKEEDKITRDIHEAMDSYEIKTKSSDILMAYEKKQKEGETKMKTKKWPLFAKIVPAVSVGCCLAVVMMLTLPKMLEGNPVGTSADSQTSLTTSVGASQDNTSVVVINPQANNKGGTRSQTAFQVASGVNMLKNISGGNIRALGRQSTPATELQFEDVAKTFDGSFDTVMTLFETGINVENTIEEGVFEGKYDTYTYKMTVHDIDGAEYVFLNNLSFEEEDQDEDETETTQTFTGEIALTEEESLKVIVNKEVEVSLEDGVEEKEEEIEMEIQISETSKIKIEQEIENEEKEYSYRYTENNVLVIEEKFSIENKKETYTECKFKIKNQKGSYVFDNVVLSEDKLTLTSGYEFEEKEVESQDTSEEVEPVEVAGSMSLAISETERVYSDVANGYVVTITL